METAISALIGYRTQTIVPNVSWGLGLRHECDMLVLDNHNRFTEIEIKISISDLKADFKKGHKHDSKYISRLVYAVPEKILDRAIPLIPKGCGIIVVKWNGLYINYFASWHTQCKHNKLTEKVPDKIIRKFMELGCMRIWSLKYTLNSRSIQKHIGEFNASNTAKKDTELQELKV